MLMVFTLALRFEKTHYRRLILVRKLLKGESIKGYNARVRGNIVESISSGAGAVAV